jgi:phospholipase C
MACFNTQTQLPVIYQLATQFALCDNWYSSLPGPTWPNRYFVHGASSAGLDRSPTSGITGEITEFETTSGFAFPNGSIFDRMNNSGIRYGWRLYNDTEGSLFGSIAQVASLKGIFLSDVNSLDDFAADLKGPYPYMYTFIEPNYGDVSNSTFEGGSSQHPMDSVTGGEALIKKVYEAIRNSPIWNNSVLIVTYDEHGGFYDSATPPSASAPNDNSPTTFNQYGFTFTQLGVRVPAVVVSPFIPAGTVWHDVHDHSSVLKTLETWLGLQPLTNRDRNAIGVSVPNYQIDQGFRGNCPLTLNNPAQPAVRAPMAVRTPEVSDTMEQQPLPESGNLAGFLSIVLKTELELSSGTPEEKTAIVENFRKLRTRGQARTWTLGVMLKHERTRRRKR